MKKGISLIVLVITIIVMIILAASIVITLSNTGVINKANDAVTKTNLKEVEQLASIVWAEEYMNGKRDDDLIDDVLERLEDYKDQYDIEVNNSGVSIKDKNSSAELGEVYAKVYRYTSGDYDGWCFMELANTASYVTKETNAELVKDYGNIGDYDMIYNGWSGPEVGNLPWYDRTVSDNGGVTYTQKHDIIVVDIVTPLKPKSMSCWFMNMYDLEYIYGLDKVDTSEATNMSNLFSNCCYLTDIDVSKFNTSKVTDMSFMFANCENITELNLNNFNTSNVVNMECIFGGADSLTTLNISSFNTSKVENMGSMFSNCPNIETLDLSNFNTSNVTYMVAMFQDCKKLSTLNVNTFDTSKVENMDYMFAGCCNLVGNLDVSHFVLPADEPYKMLPSCVEEK